VLIQVTTQNIYKMQDASRWCLLCQTWAALVPAPSEE